MQQKWPGQMRSVVEDVSEGGMASQPIQARSSDRCERESRGLILTLCHLQVALQARESVLGD